MAAKLIIPIGLFISSVALMAYGLIKLLSSQNDLLGGAIDIFVGAWNLIFAIILLQFHHEDEKLTRADSSKHV